jgi:hypothetical protein
MLIDSRSTGVAKPPYLGQITLTKGSQTWKIASVSPSKSCSMLPMATGQGRRVADFILAWWNADVHGGFNLTRRNADRTGRSEDR